MAETCLNTPHGRQLLKSDALGTIELTAAGDELQVERYAGAARPGLRWLARQLGRREAQALSRLAAIPGIPKLIALDSDRVARTYLGGAPMHRSEPPTAMYFRRARRLLRQIHRAGIVHNDLAKEANWLCLQDQGCGIVDFQLALFLRRRGPLFRLLAREDLRHLLKHKRRYAPGSLTARECSLLANPSLPARFWRGAFKPVYHFVTRRLLGWEEREGPEER